MRRELTRRRSRGFTLIELMVAIVIGTLLLGVAVPYFGDFIVNSRMRDGVNTLLAESLYAQSEALRRNGPVRLTITSTGTSVTDMTVAPPVALRSRTLGQAIAADAATVTFNSSGMPTPFGTAVAVDISHDNTTCSNDMRCPGLRIDAGGAIRVCANKLNCP